jgi:DNA polymerase-3 subunit alpha
VIVNDQNLQDALQRLFYNAAYVCSLRLHTEFSVIDGTTRIDDSVKLAAADQRPARAGHHRPEQSVRCYQVLQGRRKRQRSKPIIGAEDLVLEGWVKDAASSCHAWCCWCKTTQGYLNLSELLARAWTPERSEERRPSSVGVAAGAQ